jgi:hypothetical protein
LSACGGGGPSGKDIGGGKKPPFAGTIFIAPDTINDSDPTSFVALTYVGQETRSMYDRRVDKYKKYDAHLFVAAFDDGVELEIQVNPEFDLAAATIQAEKYTRVIGQIPYTLRNGLNDVAIHNGDKPFGGENKSIFIHTTQGEKYINEGILAETLIHESVHAVIDKNHTRNAQWNQAQQQDISFISTYAEDHPFREDLAESFLPYLAVRYKHDRISEELKQTISSSIQHRIDYFDSLAIEIYPMVATSID